MKLQEIGNTELDFHLERQGRFLLGKFEFESKPYVLQVEQKPLAIPELRHLRAAEISFFRDDKAGAAAFSTTADLHDIPFKVYSVITNRLVKLSSDFAAFYFSAEARHSSDGGQLLKKERIYRYMADVFQKRTGWKCYEAEKPFRAILSQIELHSSEFKNALDEAMKVVRNSDAWLNAPKIGMATFR
jgi:hypothetical protein